MRMPPEALREDPRGLDRGRVVQVGDDGYRPDRERPRPTPALRIVLRVAGYVDHAEYRLPDGRVEDRLVATLNRRSLRRRVAPNLLYADVRVERRLAAAADQQPAAKPLV